MPTRPHAAASHRNCNSSRLHVGGRVVIVVSVRGPQGPIAVAVSEPLVLVSRSSYVQRPREQPQFKWIDQLSYTDKAQLPTCGSEGVGAVVAPQEPSCEHDDERSAEGTAGGPANIAKATPLTAPAGPALSVPSGGSGGLQSEDLARELERILLVQRELLEHLRLLRQLMDA
eukprot:m51a1_g13583 hypothetical protein (172) ;mRNA; f:50-565